MIKISPRTFYAVILFGITAVMIFTNTWGWGFTFVAALLIIDGQEDK